LITGHNARRRQVACLIGGIIIGEVDHAPIAGGRIAMFVKGPEGDIIRKSRIRGDGQRFAADGEAVGAARENGESVGRLYRWCGRGALQRNRCLRFKEDLARLSAAVAEGDVIQGGERAVGCRPAAARSGDGYSPSCLVTILIFGVNDLERKRLASRLCAGIYKGKRSRRAIDVEGVFYRGSPSIK